MRIGDNSSAPIRGCSSSRTSSPDRCGIRIFEQDEVATTATNRRTSRESVKGPIHLARRSLSGAAAARAAGRSTRLVDDQAGHRTGGMTPPAMQTTRRPRDRGTQGCRAASRARRARQTTVHARPVGRAAYVRGDHDDRNVRGGAVSRQRPQDVEAMDCVGKLRLSRISAADLVRGEVDAEHGG